MVDTPQPTSYGTDSDGPDGPDGPDRLDQPVVESLRVIASDVPMTVSSERLEVLDRTVLAAIDHRIENDVGHRTALTHRFRIGRWLARAAAFGIAAGLGIATGWERAGDTPPAMGVVVDRGPVSVLDAHAVARLLAQSSGAPIRLDAIDLPRGVGARLDADGNRVLERADLDLLLDRIVASPESTP